MTRDRRGVLKFAPLQGSTATERLPEQIRQDLNTFVFASSGQLYIRSAALVRILIQLGGIWRMLGMLLWVVPRPLRDLGYRVVSRLRYRLFGKRETCRLPTPEERSRFLP